MPTLESLGRRVLDKRGGRGIREVAKEIGISHGTLSRVERGFLPDIATYQKICRWLGVNLSTITESPNQKKQSPTVEVHFRKQPTISPETAQALATMILTAQAALLAEGNKGS